MVSKKEKVKMFTVDTQQTGCRNHSEALEYFRKWRQQYYNDEIEVLRVKSAKTYIIFYRLKDTAQRKLDN